MSPTQLLDTLDQMLSDLTEAGIVPATVYLGRSQMALFQSACRENDPRVAAKSSTAGIFRQTEVSMWHFVETSAIVIRTL